MTLLSMTPNIYSVVTDVVISTRAATGMGRNQRYGWVGHSLAGPGLDKRSRKPDGQHNALYPREDSLGYHTGVFSG